MTVKKVMGIIALVIIGSIGLFVFMLYATIKTKSTSISQYAPFEEWVGKTVTLNRETVLYKEKIPVYNNSNYPYILLDSLHPQWLYAQEQKKQPDPDLEEIQIFPAGTPLKVEKAIQYTNGVSGFSTPYLFGTINFEGNLYKTGYQWGQMSIGKSLDKIEKCWYFHQAPWQNRQDTTFYMLPTAGLW